MFVSKVKIYSPDSLLTNKTIIYIVSGSNALHTSYDVLNAKEVSRYRAFFCGFVYYTGLSHRRNPGNFYNGSELSMNADTSKTS